MQWTEELKQQAIEMYQKAEPTPKNSTEVVAEIAGQLGATPNGLRMILTKAGVYIKTDAKPVSDTKKEVDASKAPKKTSKAEAFDALKEEITKHNLEMNVEIIEKFTGKAAEYVLRLLKGMQEE